MRLEINFGTGSGKGASLVLAPNKSPGPKTKAKRSKTNNASRGISVTGEDADINPEVKLVKKRIPRKKIYRGLSRPVTGPESANEPIEFRKRKIQMLAINRLLNLVNAKTNDASEAASSLGYILAEQTYSIEQLQQAKNILADSLDGLADDHDWGCMVHQIRNRDIDFMDRSNNLLKPLSQYLKHR